jgi:hypothetical protein
MLLLGPITIISAFFASESELPATASTLIRELVPVPQMISTLRSKRPDVTHMGATASI